jgi:DNA-binding CsgD family transcriptional regulator
VLVVQGVGHLLLGDWERAALAVAESRRVTAETGQPIWTAASMGLEAVAAGLRGDTARALRGAADAEAAIGPAQLNNLLGCVQLARGLADIGAGAYEAAFGTLARMFDPDDASHHRRESFGAVVFLADAAARGGRVEQARRIVAGMEQTALVTSSPLLHTQLLYARAVLADDADAEPLYRSALARDLTRWPLVRAMLELAYGSWLRRCHRVAESRGPLRSAQTALELIGATVWAEQARAELRAAGESAGERAPSASQALSAQELEIARLAAGGLSNREIGDLLFLSPRTIGSHLYRIFPKLGVTARGQLAAKLGADPAGVDTRPRSAAAAKTSPRGVVSRKG